MDPSIWEDVGNTLVFWILTERLGRIRSLSQEVSLSYDPQNHFGMYAEPRLSRLHTVDRLDPRSVPSYV